MSVASLIMELFLAVFALTMLPAASAGSINCKGSYRCITVCTPETMEDLANIMHDAIAAGHGSDYFQSHEQIACITTMYNGKQLASGGCCAFYQKGADGTLKDAKQHLKALQDHKCKVCGSNSVYPGEDVKEGEFTVNWVWDRGCDQGYCSPPSEKMLPPMMRAVVINLEVEN